MAALLVAGLGAGVIALVDSGPEGDEATDYDAEMFARHISRPVGDNADDYVRAALRCPRRRRRRPDTRRRSRVRLAVRPRRGGRAAVRRLHQEYRRAVGGNDEVSG